MSSYQPKFRHRAEKKSYTCASCGKALVPSEAFQYVDGNNASITQNSPILCAECYAKRYGSTS